jgi:1-acyl-sn-glycerol-3-phosphate acyltransferase
MLRYWLGRLYLGLIGWTVEHPPEPVPPKYVFIAAPHTSNWDLPHMLAVGYVMRVRIKWLGKHTLFKPPFGFLMRLLGGIPVDRRAAHDTVRRVVEIFDRSTAMILAVPPEGTRSKRDYWKSGFYHIAAGAKVPIGFAYLDYAKRRGGIGGWLVPTGDLKRDMDAIRAFYADKRGKDTAKESVPRLREEDEPDALAPGSSTTKEAS